MKGKGPFPLFINDLERDTLGWSEADRWRYLKLLTYLWWNGGTIPDNLASIAESAGVNRNRNWKEKAYLLKSKLDSHPTETGLLTQFRILQDLQHLSEIKAKRANYGRQGGLAKAKANATAETKQKLSTLSPIRILEDRDGGEGGPGGEVYTPSKSQPKRNGQGHRITEDWCPTDDDLAWGFSTHPNVDLAAETEAFRNHWLAEAGQRSRKVNWSLAWRNWIKRADEYGTKRRGNGKDHASDAPRIDPDVEASLKAKHLGKA